MKSLSDGDDRIKEALFIINAIGNFLIFTAGVIIGNHGFFSPREIIMLIIGISFSALCFVLK